VCKGRNQNRLNKPPRNETNAGAKAPDKVYRFVSRADKKERRRIADLGVHGALFQERFYR